MSKSTQIFVNLPVKDLSRSIDFFTKLGFTFNPQFTDENATCMIIGENIFAMLVVEPFFKTFTKKEICDATKSTEAIVAISADTKEHVNDLVSKALAAGGKPSMGSYDHDISMKASCEGVSLRGLIRTRMSKRLAPFTRRPGVSSRYYKIRLWD